MNVILESPETSAKDALARLTADVVQVLKKSGQDPATFGGIAFYNLAKDEIITQLPTFGDACSGISRLPLVAERYGIQNTDRLALQWVYQTLPRLATSNLDAAGDALWEDFLQELNESQWTFRGVSNLRHFTMENGAQLEPIDGVSIVGRSIEDLGALGFDQHIIDALIQDWGGFGSSSYVLVVETRVNKTPENFITSNDGSPWVKSVRLIQAMRLARAGDVTVGQMHDARPVRFNVGIGGHGRMGWSIPAAPAGATYTLTNEIWTQVENTYTSLQRLETLGYKQGPGNLDLALRSFMATYDRWPPAADTQLIDSITAAEAVLGTETEITFRLAFRIAGILAADSVERAEIFQAIKAFYDTRSKLVHGGTLKPKHHASLSQVHVLRGYVRTLLGAFVRIAASNSLVYDRAFFSEKLDLVLQDDQARQDLRSGLGI